MYEIDLATQPRREPELLARPLSRGVSGGSGVAPTISILMVTPVKAGIRPRPWTTMFLDVTKVQKEYGILIACYPRLRVV